MASPLDHSGWGPQLNLSGTRTTVERPIWKPLWVQKAFDSYAELGVQPVPWRHLIGFAAFGVFFSGVQEDPWSAFGMAAALVWFVIALGIRHQEME